MSKDYTGVPHTCGDIDSIIEVIEKQVEEINSVIKDDLGGENYFLELVIKELLHITTENRYAKRMTLEKLRDANVSLRDFGNETYEQLREAQDTISNLENDIAHLEDEIKELKKEVEELQ